MREYILKRPWALFAFSLVWSGWMLFVGALPNLLADRSLESLTFEYRDYLLRLFVVYLVAHLFVRRTSFALLWTLPPLTLALQLGVDVYDFSEWYSRTFRVNLHELNAQLFVVPVQLGILCAGIYFCARKKLRTTTRIFATTMLAGSIISTLGFHLAIVNVSYKPIERIYAASLDKVTGMDEPEGVCAAMGFDCRTYGLGTEGWPPELYLDPQLLRSHRQLLTQLFVHQIWLERVSALEHRIHSALVVQGGVVEKTASLPADLVRNAYAFAFSSDQCPTRQGAYCWDLGVDTERPDLSDFSTSIMLDLMDQDVYLHTWLDAYDFDGDGVVSPSLMVSGRNSGRGARVVATPLPLSILEPLVDPSESQDIMSTHWSASNAEIEPPAKVQQLLDLVESGQYQAPTYRWVDKALSLNPVLYINRPEFLRSAQFYDGHVRIFTTPSAFSSTTLDIKISFNLIIALFSVSWLTLGTFLILFHTRRELLRSS